MKLERIIGKTETIEETNALNEAQKILDSVGLDLIGTRPKDR